MSTYEWDIYTTPVIIRTEEGKGKNFSLFPMVRRDNLFNYLGDLGMI